MKTRDLVLGALFSAITLLIIFVFAGFLTLSIPPFTATLMAHVPLFLAMLINPPAAALVGVVSAIGFFIKLGPVVGARGLVHAVVAYVGAKMLKKGYSFPAALAVTMPVHGLLEGLVIIPFVGFNLYKILIGVGLFTCIHHLIDSVIAIGFKKALKMEPELKKEI